MYVKKLFTNDEEILEHVRLHWIRSIAPCFFGFCAVVMFIASFVAPSSEGEEIVTKILAYACFGFWLYYWLKNKTTEMVVTNYRVINKHGIIAVHMGELRNIKVESIRLHQTIFGRLLGYGNIELTGTGNTFVLLECVSKPTIVMSKIKKIIDETKDAAYINHTRNVEK